MEVGKWGESAMRWDRGERAAANWHHSRATPKFFIFLPPFSYQTRARSPPRPTLTEAREG